MAQPNERFYDASRVNPGPEVRTETGDWVAVRAMATTHFRSGRELPVIRYLEGIHEEVQLPNRVCFRVAEGTR